MITQKANKLIKKYYHVLIKDLKQKELLPLKLLFTLTVSTWLVLYPYFTIHMRELGMSVEQIALIPAVVPLTGLLVVPIAGLAADKIGNFRVIAAIGSMLGGAVTLLLLLVPVGRMTITYPDRVVLEMSGSSGDALRLSMSPRYLCRPPPAALLSNRSHHHQHHLRVETCGFECSSFGSDLHFNHNINHNHNHHRRNRTFVTSIRETKGNFTEVFKNTAADLDFDMSWDEDAAGYARSKVLRNVERYNTAVRKMSNLTYFFPTFELYNLFCRMTRMDQDRNVTVQFAKGRVRFVCQLLQQTNWMEEHMDKDLVVDIDNVSVPKETHDGRKDYTIGYVGRKALVEALKFSNFDEDHEFITINVTYNELNDNAEEEFVHEFTDCVPKCLATAARQEFCSNQHDTFDFDPSLTFWTYISIRVLIVLVEGASFVMFEGAIIAVLREHKADYGLQRVYATIGIVISSPLSGWLIDYASEGKGYTDFRPAFYLFAVMKVASSLLMLAINLEFKPAAKTVISDVIQVLMKTEFMALFFACAVSGCAWGYIENYLFWLIQDLGGSNSLMGITLTVGGIAGIPLLIISGPIIRKFGHANIVFIGFIFFGIRLMGYSLIYNPWYCLIFEAMETITGGLSYTAIVTYTAKLSTITTDSTVQSLINGLYFHAGKGTGGLLGGFLIKAYGIRSTFQIFAVGTTALGLVYFLFNHFWIRHHPSEGVDIADGDDYHKNKDIKEKQQHKSIEDANDPPIRY